MQFKNHLFIVLGILSLVLAIVGIFIPLLPTTPFLLLSAALFFRGSDRLYNWLINHKVFGKYIRNFREHKAIPLTTKIFAVATLWAVILSTAFIVFDQWHIRGILIAIAIGVTIHILHYKTLRKEERD
ncbi:MAG: DUF454 domain-containing protein [Chloroflexi bacterium]|nr:DUF454 domain-containing protein [Chloroflexota bacterium]